MTKSPRAKAAGITLFCVLGASVCQASDDFRVSPVGPAKVFTNADGTIHDKLEASGVAVLGDGKTVLVAHDRVSALFVVDPESGRILGEPLGSSRFPDDSNSKNRPKWEGLARDSSGNFYVIGSHSGNAQERTIRAQLYQFRLLGDGSAAHPWKIDDASVRRWHVEDSIVAQLKAAGLDTNAIERRKVEGLTIRETPAVNGQPARKELVIGMREPDDALRAFAADITANPPDGSHLNLAPLFSFQPGSRGGVNLQLGSLEFTTALGEPGFLVIGTTEDANNAFHGNVLWFVANSALDNPVVIWEFAPDMKAEGIDVLPQRPGQPVRAVVVFDNDPNTINIPSRIQTIEINK